jgi:hypothetical protein
VILPFGLKEFFHNFFIYHYLFLGVLFFVAVLLLILGVILRRRLIFALFFYLLSFLTFTAGPIVGLYYLEEYLRKTSLENVKVARLVYTKAIVITADIRNEGKIPLKKTSIVISLVKKNNNSILEFINIFSPIKADKIELKMPLVPSEARDVRMVVDITKITNPAAYAVYYQIKSF